MRWSAPWDGAEARLRGLAGLLGRPGAMHGAAIAFVVLALLLRLPLVFTATDVPSGHNDANIYFNHVYAIWLAEGPFPHVDRGSGWLFLLWMTFQAFDVEAGPWFDKFAIGTPEQQHAALLAYGLSAMLTVGVVAATYLLARQLLPPALTLGALVLVTFDPYLLFISTSAMSEPPYTALLVLSIAAALKARERPAWVLLIGVLMAGAHMLRVNGLVMFVMALAFALALMRAPRATRAKWGALAAGAFLLVSAPYLAWREIEGPGALEYGTNQRFWADNLWDMSDRYWTERNSGVPDPHKETMGDYFAKHTVWEAIGRLYISVQWQVLDLFGYGKWPLGGEEGGVWPGTPRDGSALTPLLTGLSLVAAFHLRERKWLFLPLAVLFTFATFVWIYPLVRSVRYFAPLVPLFVVVAMAGWGHLVARVRWPHLASAAMLALFVGLYGVRALVAVPEGLTQLAAHPEIAKMAALFLAIWCALVLTPTLPRALAKAKRLFTTRPEPESL